MGIRKERRFEMNRCVNSLEIVSYLTSHSLVKGRPIVTNNGGNIMNTYNLNPQGSVSIRYFPTYQNTQIIISRGVPVQIAKSIEKMSGGR